MLDIEGTHEVDRDVLEHIGRVHALDRERVHLGLEALNFAAAWLIAFSQDSAYLFQPSNNVKTFSQHMECGEFRKVEVVRVDLHDFGRSEVAAWKYDRV